MSKGGKSVDRIRDKALSEFQRQLALEKFQEERPQLWLQSQRMAKLVEIQEELTDETFTEGSCVLHANTVSFSSFCIKKVLGIDLDTCQATIEIYGDDHLEAGVVVLPLETIEWFGFPATAVSTGIHFEGFVGSMLKPARAGDETAVAARPGGMGANPAPSKPPVKPKVTGKTRPKP
jgi:hypothetical protein